MKRILLKVAYEGTAYHGYQSQDNGNTIEAELTRAINDVTGSTPELIGGSRTDAGVHALSNIVVFDTESPIDGSKFSYALNSRLPEDIRITFSAEVAEGFHPRRIDSVKTYEYKILNTEFEDPLKRADHLHCYVNLDIGSMKKAAAHIVGEHDFSSFCSAGAQVDSKVRTVYSVDIDVIELDPGFDLTKLKRPVPGADTDSETRVYPNREIIIRVSGNGFLYNMVRIIAGTLMEVGRGHISPDDIPSIIEAKDRTKAGPTAPAHGLCLVDYRFIP